MSVVAATAALLLATLVEDGLGFRAVFIVVFAENLRVSDV
jgi:hypothetical protein